MHNEGFTQAGAPNPDEGGPTVRLYAVILAGGSGTRFWPLSRELYPKQLLKILSDRTLIQRTVMRVGPIVAGEDVLVVTGHSHADAIRHQLDGLSGVRKENILVEPLPRNTAPAIGWAAEVVRRRDPEGVMLVMPADHIIADEHEFHEAVRLAARAAGRGWLTTFGIRPTRPETGYGYIKVRQQAPLFNEGERGVFPVARFVEKPTASVARRFLREGGFYWNSGIFVWRADTILEEVKTALPHLSRELGRLGEAVGTPDEAHARERFYDQAESISIDYGVLQKTRKAAVIPVTFRWSDVGNWSSLDEIAEKDESGNVRIGPGVDLGSRNSIVYGEQRLVATIGLQDMVVVDTADATLVCPKDRAQDVRQVVELLRQSKAPEQMVHRMVFRPWGSYTVLDEGPMHKVKRITVNPGRRLSLQKHSRRCEHWIVTEGVARVTRGDSVFDLRANESTMIPKDTPHRLENPSTALLQIIEVQSGDYLGEDDIVRLVDDYGRASCPAGCET